MKKVNLSNCNHPNKREFATTRMQLKTAGKFEDVKIVACSSCAEIYSKLIMASSQQHISIGYEAQSSDLSSVGLVDG